VLSLAPDVLQNREASCYEIKVCSHSGELFLRLTFGTKTLKQAGLHFGQLGKADGQTSSLTLSF